MDENQQIYRIIEQPIPFGERLVAATQNFFYLLALAPICIVTAPINFFRIMFTTTRRAVVLDVPFQGLPTQDMPDVEPWKRQHNDLYGEDD